MAFRAINSIEDRNEIIKEFLNNRKILRQILLDKKKIGEQDLQEATEKIDQPITKSLDKAQNVID